MRVLRPSVAVHLFYDDVAGMVYIECTRCRPVFAYLYPVCLLVRVCRNSSNAEPSPVAGQPCIVRT